MEIPKTSFSSKHQTIDVLKRKFFERICLIFVFIIIIIIIIIIVTVVVVSAAILLLLLLLLLLLPLLLSFLLLYYYYYYRLLEFVYLVMFLCIPLITILRQYSDFDLRNFEFSVFNILFFPFFPHLVSWCVCYILLAFGFFYSSFLPKMFSNNYLKIVMPIQDFYIHITTGEKCVLKLQAILQKS